MLRASLRQVRRDSYDPGSWLRVRSPGQNADRQGAPGSDGPHARRRLLPKGYKNPAAPQEYCSCSYASPEYPRHFAPDNAQHPSHPRQQQETLWPLLACRSRCCSQNPEPLRGTAGRAGNPCHGHPCPIPALWIWRHPRSGSRGSTSAPERPTPEPVYPVKVAAKEQLRWSIRRGPASTDGTCLRHRSWQKPEARACDSRVRHIPAAMPAPRHPQVERFRGRGSRRISSEKNPTWKWCSSIPAPTQGRWEAPARP